jgi:hypothetical protein
LSCVDGRLAGVGGGERERRQRGTEAARRSRRAAEAGGRQGDEDEGARGCGCGEGAEITRVRAPGCGAAGGSLYTPSPTVGSNGRGRPDPTVGEQGLGEAGRVGPVALTGRSSCRATVPRWRPRPGPMPVLGWPMERRLACRAGLMSGFFGSGPSGQLYMPTRSCFSPRTPSSRLQPRHELLLPSTEGAMYTFDTTSPCSAAAPTRASVQLHQAKTGRLPYPHRCRLATTAAGHGNANSSFP